jgi:hypothetical protein
MQLPYFSLALKCQFFVGVYDSLSFLKQLPTLFRIEGLGLVQELLQMTISKLDSEKYT